MSQLYPRSVLAQQAETLISQCEIKVAPLFENAVPPPGTNRQTRSQPTDKIVHIQRHVIGSWRIPIVNVEEPPAFQYLVQTLHPRVNLIWAFLYLPKIHQPISRELWPFPLLTKTLDSFLKSVNRQSADFGYLAVEEAFNLFSGKTKIVGQYTTVLFLAPADGSGSLVNESPGVLLGALCGEIKYIDTMRCKASIDFVGNVENRAPGPAALKELYKTFCKPGVCQKIVTLSLCYIHDMLGVPLIELENAAEIAGCLCYRRAAEAVGLLTIAGYQSFALRRFVAQKCNELISTQRSSEQALPQIGAAVQKLITNHHFCARDYKDDFNQSVYTFTDSNFLKELVMLSYCVHQISFPPLFRHLIEQNQWNRLKVLEFMMGSLLPDALVQSGIETFRNRGTVSLLKRAILPEFLRGTFDAMDTQARPMEEEKD